MLNYDPAPVRSAAGWLPAAAACVISVTVPTAAAVPCPVANNVKANKGALPPQRRVNTHLLQRYCCTRFERSPARHLWGERKDMA